MTISLIQVHANITNLPKCGFELNFIRANISTLTVLNDKRQVSTPRLRITGSRLYRNKEDK